MHHPVTPDGFACPPVRRRYDPDFGALIAEHPSHVRCSHNRGGRNDGQPVFVRRGWGAWWAVEFNDGKGGRERRRFFRHDHACPAFVDHVLNVVDPLAFAHENLRELQGAVYRAMPVEMSWAYVRHKTIDRDAAVAALAEVLDRLGAAEPVPPDELQRRAVQWLQDYTPRDFGDGWRQGECTLPRLDDGRVNNALINELLNDGGAP
jgi:hypothetical protein